MGQEVQQRSQRQQRSAEFVHNKHVPRQETGKQIPLVVSFEDMQQAEVDQDTKGADQCRSGDDECAKSCRFRIALPPDPQGAQQWQQDGKFQPWQM